jgi:hypothetical protein
MDEKQSYVQGLAMTLAICILSILLLVLLIILGTTGYGDWIMLTLVLGVIIGGLLVAIIALIIELRYININNKR